MPMMASGAAQANCGPKGLSSLSSMDGKRPYPVLMYSHEPEK
jgi:hypothetical protein